MAFTKKPETTNARRTLDDILRWRDHQAAGIKLSEKRRQLADELRNFDAMRTPPTEQEERISAMARGMAAEARGEQQPVAPSPESARITEQIAACDKAIAQHATDTRRLQIELAGELWNSGWGKEDTYIRSKIAQGILAAFEAAEEHRAFLLSANQAGAIMPGACGYMPFLNCSSCAQLAPVLKTCRAKQFRRDNAPLLKN